MTDTRVITLITADNPVIVPAARPEGRNLWLTTTDLTTATGWELKPEGACLDEVCVPLPAGREREFVEAAPGATWFNFTALADYTGRPVAHDDRHDVWYVAEETDARRERLSSVAAPDFTLPDLDGRLHTLSDHRGKKVILYAWASW